MAMCNLVAFVVAVEGTLPWPRTGRLRDNGVLCLCVVVVIFVHREGVPADVWCVR